MMQVVSNIDLWTRIQAAGLALLHNNNSPRWKTVVATIQGVEKRDKSYVYPGLYWSYLIKTLRVRAALVDYVTVLYEWYYTHWCLPDSLYCVCFITASLRWYQKSFKVSQHPYFSCWELDVSASGSFVKVTARIVSPKRVRIGEITPMLLKLSI